QINCYPPPCYLHEVKQSEDAANLPRNSSRHQIKDFGVGLLAVFVESITHKQSKIQNLKSKIPSLSGQ
ncbi:MAG: hypothetical protein QNJ63_19635, partial [Calothrix sp. MO_192.B10]|nr:hypothetical protein [Calothrix sp. MO_192.B10]